MCYMSMNEYSGNSDPQDNHSLETNRVSLGSMATSVNIHSVVVSTISRPTILTGSVHCHSDSAR